MVDLRFFISQVVIVWIQTLLNSFLIAIKFALVKFHVHLLLLFQAGKTVDGADELLVVRQVAVLGNEILEVGDLFRDLGSSL